MASTGSASPPAAGQLLDLAGRVIIVTGASSGLGRRFASALADSVALVVATARRQAELETLAAQHASGAIHVVPGDLTDPTTPEALVSAALERHGRLDGLVNNAGSRASCAQRRRPSSSSPS